MTNALWPWLLLILKPAAHGPAQPCPWPGGGARGTEVLSASLYVTVQVRRAAVCLLFQLMSMFQAGSGQFWDNQMQDMLLYVEDHETCFCQREWEQQLLQFLEDLLVLISDHTWLGCVMGQSGPALVPQGLTLPSWQRKPCPGSPAGHAPTGA
ncbi:uncharacterized protein RBU57_012070 [Macrochelys suwanniensis]